MRGCVYCFGLLASPVNVSGLVIPAARDSPTMGLVASVISLKLVSTIRSTFTPFHIVKLSPLIPLLRSSLLSLSLSCKSPFCALFFFLFIFCVISSPQTVSVSMLNSLFTPLLCTLSGQWFEAIPRFPCQSLLAKRSHDPNL